MHERLISYCGLICTECPAYQATRAGDENKAQETAELWSREYGHEIRVEDVWCDGCVVGGKKCAHCRVCEIRSCAMNRNVQSCAHCPDYACDTLTKLLDMVPAARDVLESQRK